MSSVEPDPPGSVKGKGTEAEESPGSSRGYEVVEPPGSVIEYEAEELPVNEQGKVAGEEPAGGVGGT